jgi:hypothetical protein
MTRKDYERLATHIGGGVAMISPDSHKGRTAAQEIVDAVADALAEDNPRFDRGRFFAAVYDRAERLDRAAAVMMRG